MGILFNNNSNMSLLTQASLIVTPNAVKASKLYSVVPSNGNGDMDVVRATTATRTNSLGIIESVASNVARLNYEAGSPSILVEPQRTNLVLRSEEFENAVWQKTNATITSNVVISPNNTLTADKLIPSATASVNKYINQTPTTSNGVNHSITVFAKLAEYDRLRIEQGNNSKGAWFNLSNGTIGTVSSGVTAEIKNMGNGWYSCSINTISVATNVFFLINGSNTESIQVGDGTSGIYIWGAQLEQGSYATSYIPTLGTAVTRNADVISKTGISDLIGQTQGVLFFEGAALFNDLTQRGISISDSTNLNRITIFYHSTSNNILVTNLSNNVTIFQLSYTITDTTQFAKIAIRYSNTLGASLWVNGVNRASTVNTTLPASFNRLGFDTVADRLFFGKLKQVHLYKTYLTDTEMANLTTL